MPYPDMPSWAGMCCFVTPHVMQALKDLVRRHGNGNFPLLLAFYRRKCIRVRVETVYYCRCSCG